MEQFKDLVRKGIAKAGSVKALAEAIGVSRTAIYSWLDGSKIPGGSSIMAVKHYLGEDDGI